MHFGQPNFVAFARSITFRQFMVWRSWLQLQWNKPSRSDYYVMQLNADMIGMLGRRHPPLEKFRIDWQFGKTPITTPDDLGEPVEVDLTEPPAPLTARQAFEYNALTHQQRDLARLGYTKR